MTDLSEGGIEVDCGISAGPSLSIFWLDRFEGGRDCLSVCLSVHPSILSGPSSVLDFFFCVPRWLEKWSEASACQPASVFLVLLPLLFSRAKGRNEGT